MRGSSLLPLAALCSTCIADANPSLNMAVHESIASVPPGFTPAATAVFPSHELTLRIALAHTDMAGLHARTYAVSDPANALYGKHLTTEEVAEYVSPTPEALSAVSEWLSNNGIATKSISPAGDLLQISLAVSHAATLFDAEFRNYTHVETGRSAVRTLNYSLPATLRPHVRFVHPTVAFTMPLRKSGSGVSVVRSRKRVADVAASCATTMTPSCIQSMYSIPTTKSTSVNNILGVSGYLDEWVNSQDLRAFLTTNRPALINSTFNLQLVDGGQNLQSIFDAGDEANLDVQYSLSLATGVPVNFYSVGISTNDDVEGFIDVVNFILAADKRPTVFSTSYGFSESNMPINLAVAICDAYTQLAAVGISSLFASGDGGVSGMQSTTTCPQNQFNPTLPSTCPFVTSIGGTTGLPPAQVVAYNGSSGGFSNYFPTPDYQAQDVKAYVASMGGTYAGMYNATGRGFPDVAAHAADVQIHWRGNFETVTGTSCATPIFASIIALVNDRLIAAGKPVLGFLNPFLYSAAGRAAFTDVTEGNNPGCNTAGFSASKGWDPVTGLGTPDFGRLISAVGL
ncbi:family S53 protease [Roridomyces roridus]|uniref:tripeptidyl-peptidase II n=1 Tax=Roridomyces roridus TaxID=1738132 RepID=A0AAD7B8A9_9AGAR|nr:family S53 protease [Roridomyces roridus]